jgi:hypothetical protein
MKIPTSQEENTIDVFWQIMVPEGYICAVAVPFFIPTTLFFKKNKCSV